MPGRGDANSGVAFAFIIPAPPARPIPANPETFKKFLRLLFICLRIWLLILVGDKLWKIAVIEVFDAHYSAFLFGFRERRPLNLENSGNISTLL
jgi:hypothetical protein